METEYSIYSDIQIRCKGEIYIGVMGPVRCGKSTFIKSFMETSVFPNMKEDYAKVQARDELPQSGTGKMIMTTEPKFVPNQAAEIDLGNEVKAKVRLIDCVGFMVEGALGHMEEEKQRMVKTPWFEEEIPFSKAAEIGTQKVITDHATIGVVMMTDGSFSEIPFENYVPAFERTLGELAKTNKPYVVLLNSTHPQMPETRKLAMEMSEMYGVSVLPVDCAKMQKNDVADILREILLAFPISTISFYTPGWFQMLSDEDEIKKAWLLEIAEKMNQYHTMKDLLQMPWEFDNPQVKKVGVMDLSLSTGDIKLEVCMQEEYYFEMLTKLLGTSVESEYDLFAYLQETAGMQREYQKVLSAMESVRQKGYGVVTPEKTEIKLEEPEVIHHGNKYGVKIKAQSPSVHLIKANIETEIAPIVGTKEQAEDLIKYIGQNKQVDGGIWETNIFGKTVEQMVQDGIRNKISLIGDESQIKLQDTMQKIVNDTTGGLVCIII